MSAFAFRLMVLLELALKAYRTCLSSISIENDFTCVWDLTSLTVMNSSVQVIISRNFILIERLQSYNRSSFIFLYVSWYIFCVALHREDIWYNQDNALLLNKLSLLASFHDHRRLQSLSAPKMLIWLFQQKIY